MFTLIPPRPEASFLLNGDRMSLVGQCPYKFDLIAVGVAFAVCYRWEIALNPCTAARSGCGSDCLMIAKIACQWKRNDAASLR